MPGGSAAAAGGQVSGAWTSVGRLTLTAASRFRAGISRHRSGLQGLAPAPQTYAGTATSCVGTPMDSYMGSCSATHSTKEVM